MAGYLRAYVQVSAEGSGLDEAGTPIRFVASTETKARDGLVIEQAGWRMDSYQLNPVFLWVHDYGGARLPIGRAVPMLLDGKLVADVTFDQEDAFAREVEGKYRRGFLHAVSVGFNPMKIVNGRSVETELLDISAVPVPGDPNALKARQARALEALGEELLATADGLDDAADGEVDWEGAAIGMMRLYHPSTQMPDGERKRAWNRYCVAYRKAGKTAPEFLGQDELRGLDTDTIGGLFLAGELELLPGWYGMERAGAVLSQRNLSDLGEAVRLIQGVLQRAAKDAAAADDQPADEDIQRMLDLGNKITHTLGGVR